MKVINSITLSSVFNFSHEVSIMQPHLNNEKGENENYNFQTFNFS